jgi:hypothetical protein
MTYPQAQTEFGIRLYRWAKTALEKEMLEGFPRFQLNKDWSMLRCRFFQILDHQSKTVFGRGLLQMRHQNAVELTCLAVVEHCRRMFDILPVLLENLDLQLLTK